MPRLPPRFCATQDVDAILPLAWLAAEDENLDFWEAQQRTNAELEPEGLYLTHLFRELEVILIREPRELFLASQPKVLALAKPRGPATVSS